MSTTNEEEIYYNDYVKIIKFTKKKTLCAKHYLNDKKEFRELADNEIYINNVLYRLKHKNITRYYGNKGRILVFEYSSIGSLYDYMLKNVIEDDLLKRLIYEFVCGLKAVHMAGIVHNDIKMSNILLFRDKRGNLFPKLCDFNVSHKAFTRKVVVDEPPEDELSFSLDEGFRRRDETVRLFPIARFNIDNSFLATYASDYFNLGIMIYQLIFRELPFTVEDVYKSVKEKAYARRDCYNSYKDDSLKDLIEKLLISEEKRLNDENILEHPYFNSYRVIKLLKN
jgi:serine/threonine protein kinase